MSVWHEDSILSGQVGASTRAPRADDGFGLFDQGFIVPDRRTKFPAPSGSDIRFEVYVRTVREKLEMTFKTERAILAADPPAWCARTSRATPSPAV